MGIVIRLLLCSTLTACGAETTVRYSYDAAGRIVKADYGRAGSITYAYDASGRIVKREVTPGETPASEANSKAKEKKSGKLDK